MLSALHFFLGFLCERVQKFGMQQHATGGFTAPFVIGQVKAAWQQHVGRADVGVAPVPFHQRNLVQRRGLFRRVRKKRARARTALNPQVAILTVLLDHVVAGVEPCRNFDRVLPAPIRHRVQPSLGIHIQQHRTKTAHVGPVQPISQRADRARVAEWVDEKLVWVDDQRPVPMPVARLQPVQPIDPETRTFGAG